MVKLTNSELEIMQTLWVAGKPLARHEIIEQCVEPSWSPGTIHILLNSLLQKEAIREAGFVKRNKTYGRLYAAAITGEEYYAATLFSQKHSRSFPMYVSALLHNESLTPEMLDELEKALAKRKEELGLGE